MKLKTFLLGTALAGLLAGAAEAQVSVKIGVMNDRSGLYADISGEGSVVAARMAAEDFKAKDKGHQRRDHLGRPPEQARRRLEHRPAMVRHRRGRRDHR